MYVDGIKESIMATVPRYSEQYHRENDIDVVYFAGKEGEKVLTRSKTR